MDIETLLEWQLNNIHILLLISLGVGILLGFGYWMMRWIEGRLIMKRFEKRHDWIKERMQNLEQR